MSKKAKAQVQVMKNDRIGQDNTDSSSGNKKRKKPLRQDKDKDSTYTQDKEDKDKKDNKKKQKKSTGTGTVTKQREPLTNVFLEEVEELKKTIPEWNTFFNDATDTRTSDQVEESKATRCMNWIRLEVLGQPLLEKYAWAIPDERSLNILKHFAPLIEIGAGKGYWAKLLQDMGVDIDAYDLYTPSDDAKEDESSWTEVKKGGPKVLAKPNYSKRNLFLCYPDEGESMAIECLRHFQGDHIIHVGELMNAGGTMSGAPQAPFGRTTSSDFTVELAKEFHCLLQASVPRFPFSNDCITVWKRTVWVEGREEEEGEEEGEEGEKGEKGEEEEGDEDEDDDEDEGNFWANIPPSERLPDIAAPCLTHLL